MPGGRPRSDLDAVLTDQDGTVTTIFDRFVNLMRIGMFFEHAAAACGVSKVTAYGWLRTGARAQLAAKGAVDLDSLDGHTRRCVEFLNAQERALGEYVAGTLSRMALLERGGWEKTIVTIEMKGNREVKRSTRTETALPDANVMKWRLERRFPEHFGKLIKIADGTTPPGALTETDEMDVLADQMEAYLQGRQDAETEATKKPARKRSAARPAAIPTE